ncbi:DEAD/DEAH box helicase family protein [uncultured Zobellia sp.]|uniref:DEAD/DEAH box helicase n=1 Tax=uncultured Zobellia sp. TaxID=255433 RepID=UPI0025980546|nr:DEAD/DEAH box helicase family protein [uncultured Zobellia sp.]
MEYLAGNIEIENKPIEIDLWDKISSIVDEEKGILGYKIPSLGESDYNNIPSFVLRSSKYGIIVFEVIDEKVVEFDEENEYWKTSDGEYIYSRELITNLYLRELETRLKKDSRIYDIRRDKWIEKISIDSYLVFGFNTEKEISQLNSLTENPILSKVLASDNINISFKKILDVNQNISQDKIDIIDSIFDGSDIFKKTKKKKISEEPQYVNDFIKKSLDYTFKLDHIQRQVALQVPPGPQRIRGLAGTGKTVILCMKAALAHKAFPDKKILFVFNTQSMYGQVKKAITEYYFNETKSMPNWSNLHILHAWGGSSKAGVYYNTAIEAGVRPKTFMSVKHRVNPLDAVYEDLLKTSKNEIKEKYDITLIDEAQDFSSSFFETIFHITKAVKGESEDKRIIWAYDEFQSLTDIKIREPEELFGLNESGSANIPNAKLEGYYKGKIEKDFVLPNSYRNPRISLLVAHGLALGLYSSYGKVPMEDKNDWIARGYIVHSPDKRIFESGDQVKVERPEAYSKNILEGLLKENNKDETKLVQFEKFENINAELNAVINKINWLIKFQAVEPEEIVVINLDTRNSKKQFEYIRQGLDTIDIKAITPGYVEQSDAFKLEGFVTLSTAFRAKGNEANIIFVINTQMVINDTTFRMRNAIFVAITRSRGWNYIYGYGKDIYKLEKEINDIKNDYPFFNFKFPEEDEIRRRITILQSNKNVEKVDKEIDRLLKEDDSKALLMEKLLQDPSLLEEILRLKSSQNDD